MIFDAVTRPASVIQRTEYVSVDSSGSFHVDLYSGSYHVRRGGGVYIDYDDPGRTIDVSAAHPALEWLIDGVVVEGTVRDPSGAPIDSGGVYVESDHSYAGVRSAAGHYELYLTRGSYTFAVFGRYGSGIPSQNFGPISVQTDTTLDFQVAGVELTGTVRGPGTIPLVGTAVEAYGDRNTVAARSDASGNYKMYLLPQDLRFMIRPAETWILPRLTVRTTITGPSSIDFDVDGTEWTGVVTRSDTAMPVANARVAAVLVADTFQRSAVAMTDPSGQFRLILEPGREYDLYASVDSLESAKISRVAGADTSFALEIVVPTP